MFIKTLGIAFIAAGWINIPFFKKNGAFFCFKIKLFHELKKRSSFFKYVNNITFAKSCVTLSNVNCLIFMFL